MYPIYYLEENDKKINSDFPFNLFKQEIKADIIPHGHDFLELHYVFEGNGAEIINGVEYELHPGTFACIFPHQIHEMHITNGKKICLFNFGISLKVFFESADSNFSLSNLLLDIDADMVPLCRFDEATSGKVHGILNEMLTESNEDKAFNHAMFRAKLVELLVTFYRFQRLRVQNQNAGYGQNPIKKNDIWTVIHYVYKNYRENITLKSLSEDFYLSIPYISANFKKCLGENFHTFLRKLRIEHACSLLTSSKMSVSDIAYEVGYESYSTFIRVFLQCKGICPSDYRKSKA